MMLLDKQPDPVPNNNPNLWDLVMDDIRELQEIGLIQVNLIPDCMKRDEFGFNKYHTHLQADNGRDFLADAYQEALDLVVYLKGKLEQVETDDERIELNFPYSMALSIASMIKCYSKYGTVLPEDDDD